MKRISSQENKIFKLCQQLNTKKYRDKAGLYLIEGPNLIEEALTNNVMLEFIIINEKFEARQEIKKLCDFYIQKVERDCAEKLLLMTETLFQKLSQTENAQGIFGIVSKKTLCQEEFFSKQQKNAGNVLVLDCLQDPGNVGTIIRTADAAGYGGIVFIKGTVDIYSPKVVRACTGSLFRMPVLAVDTPQQAIDLLRRQGKKIICTGFDTEQYYYQVDLRQDTALVIGNEGNGVCSVFLENADEVVKIPMTGRIESLNAAVAAAILMYESMRP